MVTFEIHNGIVASIRQVDSSQADLAARHCCPHQYHILTTSAPGCKHTILHGGVDAAEKMLKSQSRAVIMWVSCIQSEVALDHAAEAELLTVATTHQKLQVAAECASI